MELVEGTAIYKNRAHYSMRAMVASMLDRLEFRHHGIGVLQGYILENDDPEIRVHIWSPKLLKPGIDASGDVHDHRFDMTSHVLVGTVIHEVWIPEADREGDHEMLSLTHARAAAETDYHGPTTQIPGRFSVDRQQYSIDAGKSYTFPSRIFHRTPFPLNCRESDVTVTCIEKHNQGDYPARLLYPIAAPPVMAFGHKPDPEVIRSVIETAKKRLT